MKFFAIGLIIGILILPICGWLYFGFGYAPVATAAPPMPFERSFADMALRVHIRKEAPKIVPIQATTENFVAGARIYRENCSFCHGLPGGPDSRAAKGMFPDPPPLFKSGHGITDDPAR